MKKVAIITTFLLITLWTFCNEKKDVEEIKKVIQTAYVEGLQNEGNSEKIDFGIHSEFNLLGIDKGDSMWKYSIKDWKAKQVKKMENGELPLNGDKKVSIVFKSVDVTGTAAMAKIEFYIGETLTYIDYISLYKFESGWKMVNKIFYKIPN